MSWQIESRRVCGGVVAAFVAVSVGTAGQAAWAEESAVSPTDTTIEVPTDDTDPAPVPPVEPVVAVGLPPVPPVVVEPVVVEPVVAVVSAPVVDTDQVVAVGSPPVPPPVEPGVDDTDVDEADVDEATAWSAADGPAMSATLHVARRVIEQCL